MCWVMYYTPVFYCMYSIMSCLLFSATLILHTFQFFSYPPISATPKTLKTFVVVCVPRLGGLSLKRVSNTKISFQVPSSADLLTLPQWRMEGFWQLGELWVEFCKSEKLSEIHGRTKCPFLASDNQSRKCVGVCAWVCFIELYSVYIGQTLFDVTHRF